MLSQTALRAFICAPELMASCSTLLVCAPKQRYRGPHLWYAFHQWCSTALHTEAGLQELVDYLSHACKECGLTILKKTNIMAQDANCTSNITINGCSLKMVHTFSYLRLTISSSMSLCTEVSSRITKAHPSWPNWTGKYEATTNLIENYWKFCQFIWGCSSSQNYNLNEVKLCTYQACVLSTVLYGSKTFTTYASQEKKLNSFHLCFLRWILTTSWQDRVTNSEVCKCSCIPSLFAIVCKRCLRWLDHIWMDSGCIPKDMLYSELGGGTHPAGQPYLQFKDLCKWDMKLAVISINTWESMTEDCKAWRATVKNGVERAEKTRNDLLPEKWARRMVRAASTRAPFSFTHSHCGRDCQSRVGPVSYFRKCSWNWTSHVLSHHLLKMHGYQWGMTK